MKKKYIIAIALAVGLIATGCLLWSMNQNNKYPQIVYVNDMLYCNTGEKCSAVPRRRPDGVIETFVPKDIMPDAYNSANFGSQYRQLEFMFLADGRFIVKIGADWFYFSDMN